MCLHTRKSVYRALNTFQDSDQHGVLWLENGTDVFGLDCVRFKDDQEVANAVRNLRSWHPESTEWVLVLSDINSKRARYGLPLLDGRGLPEPTGRAPPSFDGAVERMPA